MATMYAGRIVELAVGGHLYRPPPHTLGLIRAVPHRLRRLLSSFSIPGSPPDLVELPPVVSFTRCAFASERCKQEEPELVEGWPESHGSVLELDTGRG